MNLPTRSDINVHDSLDERVACEHFLGKNLEQAEALFRENSVYFQEDLMFMGPAAFRVYVIAAINYIQSKEGAGDSDMVNCIASILEFRLHDEGEELRPVASQLLGVCGYILSNYERFGLDSEIYGDLRPRFQGLKRQFSEWAE
jgi:hypothetical protein